MKSPKPAKSNFQVVQHQAYCEIIFHSSETRNAFSLADSVELLKIARQMIKDKVSVLVFSNADFYFCSGGDLQSLLKLRDKRAGIDLNAKIEKNLVAFSKLPIYKIAMVGGDCFGGGMELLSCFDLRLSVSSACFGFFQKRFQLTTGWGGLSRWLASGVSSASTLLASGRAFSAYEARSLGFVHDIYSSSSRNEYLIKVLRDLSGSSLRLELLAGLRTNLSAAVNTVSSKASKSSLQEKKVFNALWWSDEHQAALKKFKQRS